MLALVGSTAGCAGSRWLSEKLAGGSEAGPQSAGAATATAARASHSPNAPEISTERRPETAAAVSPPNEQLNAVLRELEASPDFDPAIKAQIRRDLAEADATTLPILARYVQAALASKQTPPDANPNPAAVPTSHAPANAPPLPPVPPTHAPYYPSTQQGGPHPAPPSPTYLVSDQPGAAHLAAPPHAYAAGHSPPRQPVQDPRVQPAAYVRPDRSPAEASPAVRTASIAVQPAEVAERRDWRSELDGAIAALEGHLAHAAEKGESAAREQVALRFLYLAAGRGEDAARAVGQLPEPQQRFWTNHLHGLAVYLDEASLPPHDRRAAVALKALREADGHLASAGALELRNIAFCTRVDSYGRHVQFEKAEFVPDQEVLLYVEVDNFASEKSPQGYRTSLAGSYQVFDDTGRRVFEHAFAREEDVCRVRRRDFFIPYRMYVPRLAPGTYTLHLAMEDALGKKFGQSAIEFTVK